ncbi:MAG: uracil phosphoribosyltransferase [Bacteroidia bacterium]|nr:uracil phosphoribosyltransferase [Bacteroidia bacterium]
MDSRIKNLGTQNSYLNNMMYELRDAEIQKDRMRFRRNLERVAEILAYELSKEFDFEKKMVTTPLGELEMSLVREQPVIVSILRAGLPMHQGMLNIFDKADNGFVAAYRHTTKGNEFIVKVEYAALPELEGRSLIITDPMIATGRSLVLSYKQIIADYGEPENLFIAGLVASDEGLDYVQRNIPKAKIYVAAIDYELTAKAYIVPGLGDAGDLAFGPK